MNLFNFGCDLMIKDQNSASYLEISVESMWDKPVDNSFGGFSSLHLVGEVALLAKCRFLGFVSFVVSVDNFLKKIRFWENRSRSSSETNLVGGATC